MISLIVATLIEITIIYILWNTAVTSIFGAEKISFLQALGLWALISFVMIKFKILDWEEEGK